ncbi:response regulator [bacterium]|nr:response regulator [bacterium]
MENFKKRILIVDDEEDLTWSLSRKLGRNPEKLEVICANSGSKALEILNENIIDLVLTDLRMPGINGLQLLSEVRSKYPDTHVIVMTAYGSPEIQEAINHWGETEYIEKPFEIEELRNLIYDQLNQPIV